METLNESYIRLQEIINWAGLSRHSFALKIGLSRSENIYRILKNKESVSIKLSSMILKAFPEINRDWLIHGDGTMLNTKQINGTTIPFYESFGGSPTDVLVIPNMKDVEFAMMVSDRAMRPILLDGSILLMKKVTPNKIIYGRTYYLETEDQVFVRTIRKSDCSDENVLLVPTNAQEYDPITILRTEIVNLCLVNCVINRL